MMDAAGPTRALYAVVAQVRSAQPCGDDASAKRFEADVERIVRAFPSTELIVFPELYLCGEDGFVDHDSCVHTVPGPLTERLAEIVRDVGVYVAAGSILEAADGKRYNTALVLAPDGAIAAKHRKVFPWTPWERSDAGDAFTTFDMPGKGRVGLIVCYDGWFPEIVRGLALLDADLVIQVSATATPDREEELVLARANAIMNQLAVVNVNGASTYGGGRSIGVDAEGRVLFQADAGEALIPVLIDLAWSREVRARGTRGINRMVAQLGDAPPPFLDAYVRLLTEGSLDGGRSASDGD
jgi:formamidase